MGLAKLRGKKLTRVIGVIGAIGFILQGYDQAVANGLLTLPAFIRVFPEIDTLNTKGAQKSHNSTIQGTTVAIYEVGCAIGALSCGVLGDKLGRRRTIFLAGCIAIVGVIIQATPFSLGQLIAGRVITGLGVGGFTATVPMYVSESSSAESRGRMVLLQGWFAISTLCHRGCLVHLFLPESPRWLARVGREEEAASTLARLEDVSVDSEHVAQELEIIHEALAGPTDGDAAQLSTNPFARINIHRTLLAIGVNILAQMTGVNIITFYSDSIFESELGYSGTIARIISGCLQIWQVCAAGLAILLIDRFGRRPLLIGAATGMTIAQACLAGLSSDLSNHGAASASLLFYFIALFCFPIGLFLIPFMYAAEIAPLRIRAKVTAMAAAANWIFNFVIAEASPTGFATISWRYYIIYACISAFALCVFYFLCPETKGRTLEEIEEIFVTSKSIFHTVKVARDMPYQAELLNYAEDAEKGGIDSKQIEDVGAKGNAA
ncbi:hypothetical protein N7470_006679 [Penicillium chermesinum]|nr:hypothetical protein N7470_006679 [Penicillium chermesinum]